MVWRYALRRLAIAVPQLFGLLTATFFIVHLLPGDPARLIAGPLASAATIGEIRLRLGLDKPLFQQYLVCVKGFFTHLDLGSSSYTHDAFSHVLMLRLPVNIALLPLA